MRILFVKGSLGWPRTVGHDVHAYGMMRALAALGHEIGLATTVPVEPRAVEGLTLAGQWALGGSASRDAADAVVMSYLQERYRSYWGVEREAIASLDTIAGEWRADVLVTVGLEILPYLAVRSVPVRVWYAADEWVWHYLSQLRTDPSGIVEHLKAAAIKGLYERAYGPLMDRVWVVSDTERRAMRIVAGVRHVDVLPNGVDADNFAPQPVARTPRSAVFWGRLGFGPNVQALRWFTRQVWPLVRQRVPDATFTILGADPPTEIRQLAGRDGITLLTDLPDLRPEISRCEVTVLPFVSGGGIKNKLLEAAAMAQPIVATRRATSALRTPPPVVLADAPRAFADGLVDLWSDRERSTGLGHAVRRWVCTEHGWEPTARAAVSGLLETMSRTGLATARSVSGTEVD